MKLFIFSHDQITENEVQFWAPEVYSVLIEDGIEWQAIPWDGRLDSLPDDEPCLVLYPLTKLGLDHVFEYSRACVAQGHFLFYGNSVLKWPKPLWGEEFSGYLRKWLKEIAAQAVAQ